MAQQIDFNPQPAYGSDPFQPLVEGLNLGLGLQREQRAAQEFKQMQEAKKQQANLEKLNTLSGIPTQSWFKSLAKVDKDKFAKSYSGAIKNYLGVDVDIPEWKDEYGDYTKRLGSLLQSSLSENEKRAAIGNLLAEAGDSLTKEKAGFLREAAEFGLPKRSSRAFPRQVPGKVTDAGLPLFFDPELGQYMFSDPQTGEGVPYLGQQFPAASNPSASAETELREIKRQKSLGNQVLGLMTPDKLGVIDKRFKTIGNYFENSTDVEAEKFKTLASIADTIARNNFYGATLTDNEQAAFQDIAYNRSLSPSAFIARVRTIVSAQDELENALRSAAAAANRPFRDTGGKSKSSDNSDIVNMSDDELRRIIEGN